MLLTSVSCEAISCCLCECAPYCDRIPKVAPETYLQNSHGAVLKLQSTQSRCGFQAFTHAEKHVANFYFAVQPWSSPFLALNLLLLLPAPPQGLAFLFIVYLTWNFRLATKYCILRRTFTADLWAWDNLLQKGALVNLSEGEKHLAVWSCISLVKI